MEVSRLQRTKCIVEGCTEDRAVARSGYVYSRCRSHQREYSSQVVREWKARNPDYDAEYMRQWRLANPEKDAEINRRTHERHERAYFTEIQRRFSDRHPGISSRYHRVYRRRHPDRVKDGKRRRREALAGLPPYVRMDPWPTDCQCCHEPIDATLRQHTKAASEGHEPPIKWAKRHPEYTGPYVLRPEHFGCNSAKRDLPDWELT